MSYALYKIAVNSINFISILISKKIKSVDFCQFCKHINLAEKTMIFLYVHWSSKCNCIVGNGWFFFTWFLSRKATSTQHADRILITFLRYGVNKKKSFIQLFWSSSGCGNFDKKSYGDRTFDMNVIAFSSCPQICQFH